MNIKTVKELFSILSIRKIVHLPVLNYKLKGLLIFLLLVFPALINSGCKMSYSFTGASISPDVASISIQTFPNNAPLVQPTLSQVVTDALREKFQTQTTLNILPRNGDLQLEGEIVDYFTQPAAIQGDDKAATNRLTITLKVKFTNTKDPTQDFETNFSRYEDYPSNQQLISVQDGLIKLITDALVDEIFNKAVVNW